MSNFIETTDLESQWNLLFLIYRSHFPRAAKRRRVVSKWKNNFMKSKRYPARFGHVFTNLDHTRKTIVEGIRQAVSDIIR